MEALYVPPRFCSSILNNHIYAYVNIFRQPHIVSLLQEDRSYMTLSITLSSSSGHGQMELPVDKKLHFDRLRETVHLLQCPCYVRIPNAQLEYLMLNLVACHQYSCFLASPHTAGDGLCIPRKQGQNTCKVRVCMENSQTVSHANKEKT